MELVSSGWFTATWLLAIAAIGTLVFWISTDPPFGAKQIEILLKQIEVTLDEKQYGACALMYRRYKQSNRTAYALLGFTMVILISVIMTLAGTISIAEPTVVPPAEPMKKEALDTFTEITTLLIRIGIISLILYVISVLLRLYRYQLKVSDFYRSRFDGIILRDAIGNFKDDIQQWMDLTNPPYDLRTGKLPVEEVSKIIAAAKPLK